MGDRSNVELTYHNGKQIYFYTHWCGTDLPVIVANALDRGRGRWTDESYLARIIFSEMIKDEVMSDTSYGIAPYVMEEEHETICIDLDDKTVNGKTYEQWIEFHKEKA